MANLSVLWFELTLVGVCILLLLLACLGRYQPVPQHQHPDPITLVPARAPEGTEFFVVNRGT
jgi:hypothetical protein